MIAASPPSSPLNADALVRPASVHRSVYVDAAVFEAELARIFERSWIYVGHDSQVANPGDYYATHIGRHPVVMVRGGDAKIRIFLNRCLHKGAQLVGDGSGTVRNALRCGYHGWTYALDGSLRGVPARQG